MRRGSGPAAFLLIKNSRLLKLFKNVHVYIHEKVSEKMRQLKITKSITNRESASLDKYLQEIGREELVSPEEEVELAQRIRKGDQEALEKLTRANLRDYNHVLVGSREAAHERYRDELEHALECCERRRDDIERELKGMERDLHRRLYAL